MNTSWVYTLWTFTLSACTYMHMHTYMLYVYILCLCIHISMWIGHFVWLHHVCSQLKWFMFNCYFCVGVYKEHESQIMCAHARACIRTYMCAYTHVHGYMVLLPPLQCSSSIAAPSSSNTAPSGVPLNPVQPSPSLPGHSFNLPFENWVYQAQAAVYRYIVYPCTCTCCACTCIYMYRYTLNFVQTCNWHVIKQYFIWENMCTTYECMQLYITGSWLRACMYKLLLDSYM